MMNSEKYIFNYSDRYRSGSFDVRKVYRWQSQGEAYYLQYNIYFEDKTSVLLNPDEFYDFKELWKKIY